MDWYVIVEGIIGPSIIGPFETSEAAADFAYNFEWRMDREGITKVVTPSPIPHWWEEVGNEQ